MHLLPFGSETEWFMSLCHSTTYRACLLLYWGSDGGSRSTLPVMLARAYRNQSLTALSWRHGPVGLRRASEQCEPVLGAGI